MSKIGVPALRPLNLAKTFAGDICTNNPRGNKICQDEIKVLHTQIHTHLHYYIHTLHISTPAAV